MTSSETLLSIIVPAHNEEHCLGALHAELSRVLGRLGLGHELIFVDDGSSDGTAAELARLRREDPAVAVVALGRRFGHQLALSAGLEYARGDAVIMMDADLQHPPRLIHEMIRRHEQGFDVVYTTRKDAGHIPFFKRITSRWFYRLINSISDIRIEPAAADFRLLSHKAVIAYRRLSERGRFARGLITWIGFRQCAIEYEPGVREAGSSKYSLKKMVRLALDGITSFSARPLRVSLGLGLVLVLLSVSYAAYALAVWASGEAMQGWTSILISVLLIGGVQLVSIGVVGEYVGRVFTEVKGRPLYLIDEDTVERESCLSAALSE